VKKSTLDMRFDKRLTTRRLRAGQISTEEYATFLEETEDCTRLIAPPEEKQETERKPAESAAESVQVDNGGLEAEETGSETQTSSP